MGAAHPRSWAPRAVVALDALPLLATGKPDRLRAARSWHGTAELG